MMSCLYSRAIIVVAAGQVFTRLAGFMNRCVYDVISVYTLFCIFLQFVKMDDRTVVQADVFRLKKQPCFGPSKSVVYFTCNS